MTRRDRPALIACQVSHLKHLNEDEQMITRTNEAALEGEMAESDEVRLSTTAFRVWHAVAADSLEHAAVPAPARIVRLTGLPREQVTAAVGELRLKGYLLSATRLQLLVWPMAHARLVRRIIPGVSNETPEHEVANAV